MALDPRSPIRLARIAFTKEQLWELMNIFSAGFDSEDPENAVAALVAKKLRRAYDVTYRESK